jgi:bacterioferritin-associated ferredoxin
MIPIAILNQVKSNMYVCICNAVTDKEIRQAVRLGATSVKHLKESLGVAGNCGKCASCAKAIIKEERPSMGYARTFVLQPI